MAGRETYHGFCVDKPTTKSVLTSSITLKGHGKWIGSMSYFPDGQRMISGSGDKTARQWDLKAGKEIEESRVVCEEKARLVAVSRDGRWAITGSGHHDRAELKACHSGEITSIDISADNMLLASGAWDHTVQIWNLDTGKPVVDSPPKLAVKSNVGKCLEVWDAQSQTLDARKGVSSSGRVTKSRKDDRTI
ncbi:WD40 repeat-like protein [Suillus weaverae]|nr:WD40 repeat-like protein [Suillus weaverae]